MDRLMKGSRDPKAARQPRRPRQRQEQEEEEEEEDDDEEDLSDEYEAMSSLPPGPLPAARTQQQPPPSKGPSMQAPPNASPEPADPSAAMQASRKALFDPGKLTVEELRDELRARGENTVGLKCTLIERLLASIAAPGSIPHLMVNCRLLA